MVKIILLSIGLLLAVAGYIIGINVQLKSDTQNQQDEIVRIQSSDTASCKTTLDNALNNSVASCNAKINKVKGDCQASHANDGVYSASECQLLGGMVFCN